MLDLKRMTLLIEPIDFYSFSKLIAVTPIMSKIDVTKFTILLLTDKQKH